MAPSIDAITVSAIDKRYAFMLKWNIIKQQIDSNDLITNELIDEMNKFDAAKVTAEAKAYKAP